MSGFGTNISSLKAQRRLAEGTSALSRTFERLSTGQRINHASDDAAGLAIADSLRVRSRLFGAASRNINDALSMINIADSTLGDQTSILIRLKELAEQSANGVFSSVQRDTMNREYTALVREFGRLGDAASFNGISLLRSGGSTTNIQAGVDGRASSTISFANGETGTLSGVLDLDDNPDPSNFVSSGTLAALTASVSNHLFRTTLRDSSGKEHEVLAVLRDADGGYANKLRFDFYGRVGEVNSVGATNAIGDPIHDGDEWTMAGRIHLIYDPTTARVSRDPASTFDLRFNGVYFTSVFNFDMTALVVQRKSTSGKSQSTIDFSGIETVGRARDALSVLSARLDEVGTLRGNYGATQSRLSAALALVFSSKENTDAAESRIRDIDVAAESARLVSLQILQQAAASVLASANQQPQLLLNLLRSG